MGVVDLMKGVEVVSQNNYGDRSVWSLLNVMSFVIKEEVKMVVATS